MSERVPSATLGKEREAMSRLNTVLSTGGASVASTIIHMTHWPHADEPVFVLRATDELAPQVVRYWAAVFARQPLSREDRRKVQKARAIATEMEKWRKKWMA